MRKLASIVMMLFSVLYAYPKGVVLVVEEDGGRGYQMVRISKTTDVEVRDSVVTVQSQYVFENPVQDSVSCVLIFPVADSVNLSMIRITNGGRELATKRVRSTDEFAGVWGMWATTRAGDTTGGFVMTTDPILVGPMGKAELGISYKMMVDVSSDARGFLFVDRKVYTVLCVVLVVWIGIIIYLILLQGKARKLEKRITELEETNFSPSKDVDTKTVTITEVSGADEIQEQ